MKLLVLEYITGGGLAGQHIPKSLAHEGDRMLRSLVDDLLALEGIELTILRDLRYKLPPVYYAHANIIEVNENFSAHWATAVHEADAVWPIAPETDGLLENLCHNVEQQGKHLLNSDSRTVALSGSKQQTLEHLRSYNIPVVASCHLADFTAQWPQPWVIKPDDGAGCEGTRLLQTKRDWQALQPAIRNGYIDPYQWVIQPFVAGRVLSLSALFRQGQACLLSVNHQQIHQQSDGHLHLTHCEVNASPDPDNRYQALLQQVATALPGLWGYAGIDLVQKTAHRMCILEINPRLTTSYCGLKQVLTVNPAGLVVKMLRNTQDTVLPQLPNGYRRPAKRVSIYLETLYAS